MAQGSGKPRIVYSTSIGRMCPACGRAIEACVCPGAKGAAPKGRVDPGIGSEHRSNRAMTKGGLSQGAGHPGGRGAPAVGKAPHGAPVAKLRLETKGRGGKTVTVIYEVVGGSASLEDLARELKRACGTGGSAREGTIELQGDRRDRVRELLGAKGYRVKG